MNPSKTQHLRTPARSLPLHALAALLVPTLLASAPASGAADAPAGPVAAAPAALFCTADPEPPEYYAIDLVTTKNVPGTAYAKGIADVTFAASPFGVAVAPDGSYAYDIHLSIPGLPEPARGGYVAWVTTTEVDQIRRLGALEDGRLSAEVGWNKFLVVVTLEDDPSTPADRWSGPIAFRGMSRSGKMHTMAGHGPFQQEKCATYGYN